MDALPAADNTAQSEMPALCKRFCTLRKRKTSQKPDQLSLLASKACRDTPRGSTCLLGFESTPEPEWHRKGPLTRAYTIKFATRFTVISTSLCSLVLRLLHFCSIFSTSFDVTVSLVPLAPLSAVEGCRWHRQGADFEASKCWRRMSSTGENSSPLFHCLFHLRCRQPRQILHRGGSCLRSDASVGAPQLFLQELPCGS